MSSREAYQLPQTNNTSSSSSNNNNNNNYTSFSTGAAAGTGSDGPIVSYLCGECNAKVELARGTAIRCTTCGHRVLYKERTKRMVQFEAR